MHAMPLADADGTFSPHIGYKQLGLVRFHLDKRLRQGVGTEVEKMLLVTRYPLPQVFVGRCE